MTLNQVGGSFFLKLCSLFISWTFRTTAKKPVTSCLLKITFFHAIHGTQQWLLPNTPGNVRTLDLLCAYRSLKLLFSLLLTNIWLYPKEGATSLSKKISLQQVPFKEGRCSYVNQSTYIICDITVIKKENNFLQITVTGAVETNFKFNYFT